MTGSLLSIKMTCHYSFHKQNDRLFICRLSSMLQMTEEVSSASRGLLKFLSLRRLLSSSLGHLLVSYR